MKSVSLDVPITAAELVSWLGLSAVDLDKPLTVTEFAKFIGKPERWVRKRWAGLPGVLSESRQVQRIHLRTYLTRRIKNFASPLVLNINPPGT